MVAVVLLGIEVETRLDTLVAAIALLILALAMWQLVWRRGFQRIDARLGNAQVMLEAVNRRVNDVPPGTPPMPLQLDDISSRLDAIERQLGETVPADVVTHHLDAIHRRLDGFLAAEEITDQFAAVNRRLDTFAENAAKHHPEDS